MNRSIRDQVRGGVFMMARLMRSRLVEEVQYIGENRRHTAYEPRPGSPDMVPDHTLIKCTAVVVLGVRDLCSPGCQLVQTSERIRSDGGIAINYASYISTFPS
jgi:hypothetical protein